MKFLYPFFLDQIKPIGLSFLFYIISLQILGLISLYSATYLINGENLYLFKQQLAWMGLGWLGFFIIYYSKFLFNFKIVWILFFINCLCLILTFFVGKEFYNAKRWLDLGWFHYQPSETLKLTLMLLIAKYLSQSHFKQILYFKDLIKLCFLIVPPIVLVTLQPDLGTAGIILLMASILILFKGIEKRTLIILVVSLLISTPLIWSFLLKPYQKSRIISFIKPGIDPQGTGYNAIQSKIAVGSGQLFGKGFKQGTQNKLQFLPERHSDFIFSVLSEEYGFLGSSLTLILFFLMLSFIFKLASTVRDRLSCYYCIGIGAFFLWHIVLNLAMTMGFFPIVGIPLPLFSYGGSHTLTVMIFLGLVASIHRKKDLF